MHSVISFNRDLHLQCETPHYIYLGAVLSLLLVAVFVRMAAVAKLVFLLLVGAGYVVVVEFIDRAVFRHFFLHLSSLRSEVPTDITGICMIVHFLVAVYVCGRGDEWIQRLHFLWTQQSAEQQQELIELETENERLLLNILPRHVMPFFTVAKPSSQELYAQAYSKVIVGFASVIGPTECDITAVNFSQGHLRRQGLRLLRDVFAGFDEHLEENRFVAVDKIKTIGNVYMFCVGLKPQHMIEETEDSMYRNLVIALQFVSILRNRLSHVGDCFALRVGMSICPVVAGVVGARKPQYDVWGCGVNMARALERTGLANNIHVADDVYKPMRTRFQFQCRGLTKLKSTSTNGHDSASTTTYFLVTDDRHQLPPISPVMSRDRLVMSSSQLPCVVQCCSSAHHPRTHSNGDVAAGSPMYGRLQRATSARDSGPPTPSSTGGPKVSMTPPSSLGRHRRDGVGGGSFSGPSTAEQSRRLMSSGSAGGSGNLAVPMSSADRGCSPDLPTVHFCNANMLGGARSGNELAGNSGGSGGGMQFRGIPGHPPGGDHPRQNSNEQLIRASNCNGSNNVASAARPASGGSQRTSSEPQLNCGARPVALSRSNSQQQPATSSAGLPSIRESSSQEVQANRRNDLIALQQLQQRKGGQPNFDIDSIMQELADSAGRIPDGSPSRRPNQSCQTDARHVRGSDGREPVRGTAVPTSPRQADHLRSQSNTADAETSSKLGGSAAFHGPRSDRVFHPPASEGKVAVVWDSVRPVSLTKSSGDSTRERNVASGGSSRQRPAQRRQLEEFKTSPPPLPPPPNENKRSPQQPVRGVNNSSVLASPQRPSAFKPVQKSANLLPTPSNAIYGIPLHRLYPLSGGRGGPAAAPSGNQIYSQLASRGAQDGDRPDVQMRRRPQPDSIRPSGGQLGPHAPSFRVRRSACVQSLPRLCRSMENLPSDVDDCGPRSGSSSRPDSPTTTSGSRSRAPPPVPPPPRGLPMDQLLLMLRGADDVSLSSFDGTGSEMSRSDPNLSSYETFGGGSVGGFESEYDNYRPGMASDEDYFVPDPISDIDIDMFDDVDVDVENVTVRDTFPPPGGALPPLHKLTSDI